MKHYWLKYRKWVIFSGVAVWILFLDTNNLINLYKNKKELNNLKDKKAYYQSEIEKMKLEKEVIFNNKESIEQYAREKYLMKKENEDIYIIKKD